MPKHASLIACIIVLLLYAWPYGRWLALDPDSFWHLRTGSEIIRTSTPALPEVFSHAAARHSWVNHEWLTELVYAASFQSFGEAGLLFLRGGIFAATLLTLFLLMGRAGTTPALSLLLVSQIARPVLGHFSILSPYTITSLWVLLLLHLLHGHERRPLLLFLLFASWANLHAGFAFGLVMVGFDCLAEWRRGKTPPAALGPLAIACLATLATPFHLDLWVAIAREMTFSHAGIPEWQSLSLSQSMLWLVLVVPAFIWLMATRWEIPLRLTGGFLVAAVLCLQHQRFIAMLALLSLGVISSALARRGTLARVPHGAFAAIVILATFGEAAGSAWQARQHPGGVFVDTLRYPVHAVRSIPTSTTPITVASIFDWGGYLIYTRGGQLTVHIDGRGPWVYAPAYIEQVLTAEADGDLAAFLAGAQPSVVIVRSGSRLESALFAAAPRWREFYHDSTATLFTDGSLGHLDQKSPPPSLANQRHVSLTSIESTD